MGQARRRKLAGTYPDPDSPIAKARRFWCGRAPIAAEDFVAPEGVVAITFDVEGEAPSTSMFDAAKVVEIEADVAAVIAGVRGVPEYRRFVAALARQFLECRRQHDDHKLGGIAIAALWTALNHPESGSKSRVAISALLRRDGKAHITWHFGKHGFAIAVGGRFEDLEPVIAAAPKDRVTSYGIGLPDEGERH